MVSPTRLGGSRDANTLKREVGEVGEEPLALFCARDHVRGCPNYKRAAILNRLKSTGSLPEAAIVCHEVLSLENADDVAGYLHA